MDQFYNIFRHIMFIWNIIMIIGACISSTALLVLRVKDEDTSPFAATMTTLLAAVGILIYTASAMTMHHFFY